MTAPSWRGRAIRITERLGLKPTARALYNAWRPAIARRDAADMQNLSLLLRFWLRPASNCIDIGANRGDILEQFVTNSPHGRHIAFEPIPRLAAALRDRFPTVDVRALALSDRAGSAEFTHVLNMPAMSGLRRQWYPKKAITEQLTVDIARLDDCIPADYVPALVKIDVEGAEVDVIRGGMQFLCRHRPIVVFEHFEGGAASYGHDPRHIWALLVDEANMQIRDIDGMGPYSLMQMEEAFHSRRMWTWVATPATPD